MIKSMTGFARNQKSEDYGTLIWEVRTVNHRYLDINIRLPDDFRALESRYRELISKRLTRGKLEANLRFKPEAVTSGDIQIDSECAKSLVKACQEINNLLHQPSEISTIDLLKWPGIVKENEKDMKPVFESSENLLIEALDELIKNREREGERMKDVIVQRCISVVGIVEEVKKALPEIQNIQREKILSKIQELQAAPDMDRFEQELAYLAQKMDVDEELDRLSSHVEEIKNVLDRDEAIGRRLDFLMQEFNREANTLGSKSIDIKTTQASVELKVLIEQMREQIQNIE